jgi:hypothetical protein
MHNVLQAIPIWIWAKKVFVTLFHGMFLPIWKANASEHFSSAETFGGRAFDGGLHLFDSSKCAGTFLSVGHVLSVFVNNDAHTTAFG